ncbi:hypothetical protein KIN20_038427 [Parelaphostrongylus tenuis]|uniref:C2H2-type domain-containing protein n=1 Tax=Parelaphostrongylus tenuis TaxID=148309 RepID=A0AAD5MQZ0_PARTN|nr:hypothetical protein KIN20_038427 [Parelaphostrongylus tenuis]
MTKLIRCANCPECLKSLRVKYMGEHLVFVHKYTVQERKVVVGCLAIDGTIRASIYPFKCDICLENFQTKRELTAHQIGLHGPLQPSTPNEIECAFDECDQSFATSEDFAIHCSTSHSADSGYQFKIINESFEDMQALLDWKADIEENTCTSFRIRCSNDRHIMEFECHRNGSFITLGTCGDIKLSKTNCTAFMKCWTRRDGSVEVIACTEHVGHEKDPRKLLLGEKQEDELRRLISEGLSASEIYKKVRQNYNEQSRMYFLTDTDLALLVDNSLIHEQVFGTQKNNYKCPQCDEGPMHVEKLRSHIREVHERVAETANTMVVSNTNDKNGANWSDIYYCCEECQFLCFTESVLDAHVQTYHPIYYSESCFQQYNSPSFVRCSKCKMKFKTNHLLAVHTVNAHSDDVPGLSPIQASFTSWAKFEPWLEKVESTTNTTLIKTAVQSCGTKLIHSYNCQFSRAAKKSHIENDDAIDCPAFVMVIENEDGILDCAAFFGHLGHQSNHTVCEDVCKKEVEAETPKADTDGKVENGGVQPCCLCGNVVVPEIDAMTIAEDDWSCCSTEECKAMAHNMCIQLLGEICIQCERGTLIGNGKSNALSLDFSSSIQH